MTRFRYADKLTCAYLYPISKYGYPPDARQTVAHIEEMSRMGFSSIELEGIGEENIRYLYQHRAEIAESLAANDCAVPVFCVVLPQLGSGDASQQLKSLELFDMGCETAQFLGAEGVLDNGPLIPLEYPADLPIMRHYSAEHLSSPGLPAGFNWNTYWENLTNTYKKVCNIAAKYHLVYHLHPCEGSLITGTDSFINFSEAVGCDNLHFNLDTANQFYSKDNLPLSVIRLGKKITYIHISDNRGTKVEHLVPGDGNIYWQGFFEALQQTGFNGHLAIDVGGAETGIQHLDEAYHRSAAWLQEKIGLFLPHNNQIN